MVADPGGQRSALAILRRIRSASDHGRQDGSETKSRIQDQRAEEATELSAGPGGGTLRDGMASLSDICVAGGNMFDSRSFTIESVAIGVARLSRDHRGLVRGDGTNNGLLLHVNQRGGSAHFQRPDRLRMRVHDHRRCGGVGRAGAGRQEAVGRGNRAGRRADDRLRRPFSPISHCGWLRGPSATGWTHGPF